MSEGPAVFALGLGYRLRLFQSLSFCAEAPTELVAVDTEHSSARSSASFGCTLTESDSLCSLTIPDLLLDQLFLRQLWLLWLLLFIQIFLRLELPLNLILLLPLHLQRLLSFLLVGKVRLLLLNLHLLVNYLLLAWFLTVVMAARMLFLVPSVAARARFRHQPDFQSR